jgi:hypothetical protein
MKQQESYEKNTSKKFSEYASRTLQNYQQLIKKSFFNHLPSSVGRKISFNKDDNIFKQAVQGPML